MGRSSESSIVTKCAKVMDALSEARHPLAFSDIVAETGFVKSSCHRILAVLQGEGLIEYDKDTRTYRTGPRLHQWSRSAWRRIDLQQVAGSVISRLSEETGMNTALSVLDTDTVLYLRTADQIPVRYASHAGDHAPLHCTAAGKVFLAYLPETRRKAVLASLKFEKFTEFTKTAPEELMHELPGIAVRGYAMAIREESLQVFGLAAPIWNAQDEVTASLSLWTLTEMSTQDELEARAGAVKEAANTISRQIGWRQA